MAFRTDSVPRLRSLVAPSVAAVRRYWPTFVVIQLCGFGLIFWYYQSPPFQAAAAQVAAVKVRGGIAFAFMAGFLAGTVVPETFKFLTGKGRRMDRAWIGDTFFTGTLYGFTAMMVDTLYRFQAIWFGDGTDLGTLTLKTAVDMFVFSTFVFMPFGVAYVAWRRNRYSLLAVLRAATPANFVRHVVPTLLPCWAFWIPTLYGTYALPTNLQFLYATLAEAAWSIIFVFIATGQGREGHA